MILLFPYLDAGKTVIEALTFCRDQMNESACKKLTSDLIELYYKLAPSTVTTTDDSLLVNQKRYAKIIDAALMSRAFTDLVSAQ